MAADAWGSSEALNHDAPGDAAGSVLHFTGVRMRVVFQRRALHWHPLDAFAAAICRVVC